MCLQENLIIELDGSQHLENQEYDESRTKYLNVLGFRVLRFWNNQVLLELPVVLHAIYYAITSSPLTRSPTRSALRRSPSPARGEGKCIEALFEEAAHTEMY